MRARPCARHDVQQPTIHSHAHTHTNLENSHRMGHRIDPPTPSAALATGLVVAGSSAAQAQSITDVDAAGDMVGVNDDAEEEPRPTPNQVRNDVLTTTMAHSATRISIRVKYAELRRRDDGIGQYVQVVTNEGVRRGLAVSAGPGDWAGSTVMWRERDESQVRCAIRHSIDYTRNVIAVSFPRRCASSPRWVEVPRRRI
jgi:hypothetical protein